MTLGVDAPRILSGSSLSQDIASMRSQLEKYSQAEALVKRAYEDVNIAAAFLKARDYDQAVKYLEQAMKVARENTTFVQALQPVILNLQAEISAGREQWALSESQYGKLIAEWDALTPEDKENSGTIWPPSSWESFTMKFTATGLVCASSKNEPQRPAGCWGR